VDFLFLDHAKDMYLEDLKELEHNRFIKRGSHVAADNVIFNRLDGYRKHVRDLANKFITETRLAEMTLEYSDDIKDGIGKSQFFLPLASAFD
jgi:catechol O-methyltransferase